MYRVIQKGDIYEGYMYGIMVKNHDYSCEWDIKYDYPNSFILRNKLNITNSEKLNIISRIMIVLGQDN